MKQAQETSKRIVSKGEYVKVQRTRLDYWTKAGAMLAAASAAIAMAALDYSDWSQQSLVQNCGVSLMFTAYVCACVFLARRYRKKARAVEQVVPLTRANTADLPANDSLVRASSEPLQAQEAVLLRAAMQDIETPPEQLLRAGNGQE